MLYTGFIGASRDAEFEVGDAFAELGDDEQPPPLETGYGRRDSRHHAYPETTQPSECLEFSLAPSLKTWPKAIWAPLGGGWQWGCQRNHPIEEEIDRDRFLTFVNPFLDQCHEPMHCAIEDLSVFQRSQFSLNPFAPLNPLQSC